MSGLSITNNYINKTAYNGINLGWGWQNFKDSTTCKNNSVNNNRLVNTLNRLHDSGAVYTLGQMPGTTINGNYVKGIPAATSGPTYGLHNDEGSAYITENDNVLDIDPGVKYTINCEDYGAKHDLTIRRTYATVNKMGVNPPTSTIDPPVAVADNVWPATQYTTCLNSGIQDAYRAILPSALVSTQDYVFPASCALARGTSSLGIRSSGDASNAVWFAPAGTTTLRRGRDDDQGVGNGDVHRRPGERRHLQAPRRRRAGQQDRRVRRAAEGQLTVDAGTPRPPGRADVDFPQKSGSSGQYSFDGFAPPDSFPRARAGAEGRLPRDVRSGAGLRVRDAAAAGCPPRRHGGSAAGDLRGAPPQLADAGYDPFASPLAVRRGVPCRPHASPAARPRSAARGAGPGRRLSHPGGVAARTGIAGPAVGGAGTCPGVAAVRRSIKHDLEGLDVIEIARELSITKFGVYARLYKGRKELASAVRRLQKEGSWR